jgi:hypothetical protein
MLGRFCLLSLRIQLPPLLKNPRHHLASYALNTTQRFAVSLQDSLD